MSAAKMTTRRQYSIHIHDEHAVFLALLVDAVEIFLVNQVGDGLVGHVSAGGQRGDGGQIELAAIALDD